ncbi:MULTISPECIES: hypothetical protein [Cysteiniphilum]|uniref:hypothetical protein n=1 Tax=Cysteiniphilum TaxID=2056696 RepID=UPI001785FAB2|nr:MULTISPECIES: hypothetical protein [Cysteiniphilum]
MIGMAQAQEDVMYFSNQTSKGSASNGQNLSAPALDKSSVVESFADDASNFEDIPVITVADDQVSDYNPDDPLEIMGTSVYDGGGNLSSVTFSVGSGALYIANAAGRGNNTHTVTVTGYDYGAGIDESQGGIDAALRGGVQYMPVHNFKGDTSVTVNAIDDAGNRAQKESIAITVEDFPEFITASCEHDYVPELDADEYLVTYKLDPGDKVLDNVMFSNLHGSSGEWESTTEFFYVQGVYNHYINKGKSHGNSTDMFYRATFKDGSTLDRYMTCTHI